MKKIYCISFILVFCFIFTGCFFLWCEPDTEIATLSDVTFAVSPEKDKYTIGEEMVLTFSQIPDFSFFGKYSFVIKLEEFKNKNEYITTDKVFFISEEPNSDSVSFAYEEKDLDDSVKMVKTFSIKAVKQGKFSASIHGYGYIFNNKGGYSTVGYDKRIYIDVVE